MANGDPAQHPYIGANAGCWNLYGQVLAKEYEQPFYFVNHRLTVDAYAIQHPGVEERRSIQSVNVHLISLGMIFIRGISLDDATKAMGPIIDKHSQSFSWLVPPDSPYEMSVLDVLVAKTAEEHCALVIKWARHVWDVWKPHHHAILEYLE